MAQESPIPVETQPWQDWRWDELLTYIEQKRVIPIIGPDLLQLKSNGEACSLDRHIATQLISRWLPELTEAKAQNLPLNEAVCIYLREFQAKRKELPNIYWAIHNIWRDLIQEDSFLLPEPLLKLARIRHFNLFVTTTFDSLLEQALNKERFGGEARTQTIAFSLNKQEDFTSDLESLDMPVVYHLLGKVSAVPDDYVISDEDLLEFVHALQGGRRPAQLFCELEKNHLLILGGNFADWLTRFFLRAAKGCRLSGSRTREILADACTPSDRSLVRFLKHFSHQTMVFERGAVEFVNELYRRWEQRSQERKDEPPPPPPPGPNMQPGAVFISYARQDQFAVRKLYAGLKKAGLDIWFDEKSIQPGDHWLRKIETNIRTCACFLVVVSQNTDKRLEGAFHREWVCALDRAKGFKPDATFIVPVLIDDSRLPADFEHLDIVRLRGGEINETLTDTVKKAVDFYRKNKSGK